MPDHLFIAKIILLYDALREYLECVAMKKGYKLYNHECYTAFLKEIMRLSREGDIFDNVRKIRSGINYYGKEVNKEEAEQVIFDVKELIEKFSRQKPF